MLRPTLLFLLIVTELASANKYLVHHVTGKKGQYNHKLSLLDDAYQLNQTIKVGDSALNESVIATDDGSDNIIFYLPVNKGHNSQLVIYEKNSLNEKVRIQVPEVIEQSKHQLMTPPLFLSENKQNVIFINRNQGTSVNIYDINSGKVLLHRPISKQPIYLAITKDQKYLYTYNLEHQSRLLMVVDLNSAKTTVLENIGGSDVVTQLHQNTLLISKEKKTQRRPVFELYQIRFSDGKKIKIDVPLSEYHFVFANNGLGDKTYVAGKKTKNKRDLFVFELNRSRLGEPAYTRKKVIPRAMEINQNNDVLMIIGEDKMMTVDAINLTKISDNRLPFDVVNGILNKAGSLGIIQENSGSEIGFVDLKKGKVLAQVGAGRTAVKLSKNIWRPFVSGLLPGVLAHVLEKNYSTKSMVFSKDENKLIVTNANSNDITFFDITKQKKLKAIGTGAKTQFMYLAKHSGNKVLTANKSQINVFDIDANEELLELKPVKILGLDTNSDLVFYQNQANLNILTLSDMTDKAVMSNIYAENVIRLE